MKFSYTHNKLGVTMQRKSPGSLPERTYIEFNALAAICRLHRLKPTSVPVISEIRKIILNSSDRADFVGWTDRRISRWFFDHFLRIIPRHQVRNRRYLDKYCMAVSARAELASLEGMQPADAVDLRNRVNSLMTHDYRLSHQYT